MTGFEIQYDGVRMLGITTHFHEEEPVYDSSNTDTIHNRVKLSGSTIVNAAVLQSQNQHIGLIGRVRGGTPAEICDAVMCILGENRKRFRYIVDGVAIYDIDANSDANNGPRVTFSLRPMGKDSILLTFTAELAKFCCDGTPSPVISNRWGVSDLIGEDFLTTRTWQGTLRVSNAIHNPQAFRSLCFPPLSDGFKRLSVEMTGEPNALVLGWRVADKQLAGDAPPAPGIKLRGSHIEDLSRDGATSIGNVEVSLIGEKGADPHILLELCMRVINSRVQGARFRREPNWIWESLTIRHHFGEEVLPTVEAHAVVRRVYNGNNPDASLRLGAMVLETFGKPLEFGGGYSRHRMRHPGPYPCTTAGLLAAHLQTPCRNDHGFPNVSSQIDASNGPEQTDGTDSDDSYVSYDVAATPEEIDVPDYSSSHREAMYTHADINWIIEKDHGCLQLPYGDQLPASDATSVVIRLHAPVAKLHLRYSAERIGEMPRIPADRPFIDASGIKYTPLKFKPVMRPVFPRGDGRDLFVIDVDVVYAMSRAPEEGEYIMPALPWTARQSERIASSAFQPPLS